MAKISHEEMSAYKGNYLVVVADNEDADIDLYVKDREANETMGVRLNKSQAEQLIDTLLYWVEKQ